MAEDSDTSESAQDSKKDEEVTIESDQYWSGDDDVWVSTDDLVASGWVPPEDTGDDLPVA